jgi:hypothetical protein
VQPELLPLPSTAIVPAPSLQRTRYMLREQLGRVIQVVLG